MECRTGQVKLDGISALSLEIILNSVYTQELQLSPDIVLGVLEAAHRLEFTEVCVLVVNRLSKRDYFVRPLSLLNLNIKLDSQ